MPSILRVPRKIKAPSALKHGGYAETILLPGEDPVAFRRLHEGLIAEYAPAGALEEHTVANIARLVWRKENLATCRRAKQVQNRASEIYCESEQAIRARAQLQEARARAQEELGDSYELVKLGHEATLSGLADVLDVEEHLDKAIDRCVKRLFHLKGLKSLTLRPAQNPVARIAGPDEAAA
jgi:hypothetical protein